MSKPEFPVYVAPGVSHLHEMIREACENLFDALIEYEGDIEACEGELLDIANEVLKVHYGDDEVNEFITKIQEFCENSTEDDQ